MYTFIYVYVYVVIKKYLYPQD